MILPDQPNLALIAFLQHQLEEELEIQSRIVKARALDAGHFDSDLATQTAAYLVGGDAAEIEGINLMAIVLRTVLRRVDIQGVQATLIMAPGQTAETSSADGNDPATVLTNWLEHIWDANEMDARQGDLHRWAERDGEAFLIVSYDKSLERPWEMGAMGLPTFHIHERYTSAEAVYGDDVGSNEGCKAHYRNNDPNQPLDMVSKRWIETTYDPGGETIVRQRMTLYIAKQAITPARIEKYAMSEDGEWEPLTEVTYDENGNEIQETWPIWWTDNGTETGLSLPLPVVHFRNEEISPITGRVWGTQNGMDHMWSTLLGGGTLTTNQMFSFFGFYPTSDGKPLAADQSNALRVGPRTFIGAPEKKPGEASMQAIQPSEVRPIIEVIDKIAIYCAFVAGLPINNFVISKAVASSSTLRQGEADLVAHVHALQRLWGRAWAKALLLAIKLDNLHGGGAHPENVQVRPIWAPVETVNVEARNVEAVARKQTGVPEEYIWRDVWGYSNAEVEEMKVLKQEAAAAAATNGGTTAVGGTDETTNQAEEPNP